MTCCGTETSFCLNLVHGVKLGDLEILFEYYKWTKITDNILMIMQAQRVCDLWHWLIKIRRITSHHDKTVKWILCQKKLKPEKKQQQKKNLTLTNDNCCIAILWGSLCRQRGSWDRWRPIYTNPQTKRAINQNLCVFMGMGCDGSVNIALSIIRKYSHKLAKHTNTDTSKPLQYVREAWGYIDAATSALHIHLCLLGFQEIHFFFSALGSFNLEMAQSLACQHQGMLDSNLGCLGGWGFAKTLQLTN